jgi:hypothetical protein
MTVASNNRQRRMSHLTPALIAPCGMNCGLCLAYLREKNRCPGCRGEDAGKPNLCVRCRITHCEHLVGEYCSGCATYPCRRLKQLDKRYTKYRMSMLENLSRIQERGVEEFVSEQEIRWTCKNCGRILCVHRDRCLHCGEKW